MEEESHENEVILSSSDEPDPGILFILSYKTFIERLSQYILASQRRFPRGSSRGKRNVLREGQDVAEIPDIILAPRLRFTFRCDLARVINLICIVLYCR